MFFEGIVNRSCCQFFFKGRLIFYHWWYSIKSNPFAPVTFSLFAWEPLSRIATIVKTRHGCKPRIGCMLIWKTQKEKQLMSSMACLLTGTIWALGLIQVCLIKKFYHLSVSRSISVWSWIINAFDWILLWSSWEQTYRWHEYQ